MKIPYPLLVLLTSCFGYGTSKEAPKEAAALQGASSIYEITVTTIEGKDISLSNFKGKKIVLVNTASKCGFTPQYQELQDLHKKYGDKVVIIGTPSNDFGQQEPAENKEIKEFCKKNYGVGFLMLEKAVVKGEGKNELYSWLTDAQKNGWNEEEPNWNFCKYIIDEEGKLTNFFGSSVKPGSTLFLKALDLK